MYSIRTRESTVSRAKHRVHSSDRATAVQQSQGGKLGGLLFLLPVFDEIYLCSSPVTDGRFYLCCLVCLCLNLSMPWCVGGRRCDRDHGYIQIAISGLMSNTSLKKSTHIIRGWFVRELATRNQTKRGSNGADSKKNVVSLRDIMGRKPGHHSLADAHEDVTRWRIECLNIPFFD